MAVILYGLGVLVLIRVMASMVGSAFYEVARRGATEDFPEGSLSHREALMNP
jgi:hypothetical protein